MKLSIIKSAIVMAMAFLPLFSYGREQNAKAEDATYVEDEFIIWLEQDVDATTFAANANVGIVPKRELSKRLNIWFFDLQWAPAIMSLPQAWEEFATGGVTATGDTNVVAAIDGGEWQESPIFEGLTPSTSYTFTQRKTKTRSHYASPTSPDAVFCTMSLTRLCESHRSVFKLYPNPAKGGVTIEGTGTLTVTNAIGKAVLAKEIRGKEKVELPQGLFRHDGWRNAENRGGIIEFRKICYFCK